MLARGLGVESDAAEGEAWIARAALGSIPPEVGAQPQDAVG